MRYNIREKFFRLTEDSQITDESGQPAYEVNGHLFSLHQRLTVRDMQGQVVAEVARRIIALTATFEIQVAGFGTSEMRKKLFSPFIDRYSLDIPGPHDLEIVGSLFEHEYTFNRDGHVVATVSKRWLSLTDTYSVDIADGEPVALYLACVLALDVAEDNEHHD